MRIVAICGSLRKLSFNLMLLENLKMHLVDHDFEILDISKFPVYSMDLEDDFPGSVIDVAERILSAEALVFATPEFNFTISSPLKNAIDWLSRVESKPLNSKACAILGVSAGGLGTVRAQSHLRQIGVYFDWKLLNQPEVMISKGYSKFNKQGILTDENDSKKFGQFAEKLISHIEIYK